MLRSEAHILHIFVSLWFRPISTMWLHRERDLETSRLSHLFGHPPSTCPLLPYNPVQTEIQNITTKDGALL